MPSPIGHALAGLAAGTAAARFAGDSRHRLAATATLFAAAGVAPDLDLLFGAHSGPSHSVGAAAIAGLAAFGGARALRSRLAPLRVGVGIAAAWASHPLLDWLGADNTAPIGIMALWPFSHAYFESPLHIFMAISRRYWLAGFWTHNLLAVAREIAILGPLAAIALAIAARPLWRTAPARGSSTQP